MFFSHSHSHHHSFDLREWWSKKVHHIVAGKAVTLPEVVSYPIGVTLTNIQTIEPLKLPFAGNMAFAMVWNYFDGACSLLNGMDLLFDETDYRKIKYLKAALNILSGMQSFIFTYNPPLAAAAGISVLSLAGPVFAFSMLCDLINSAIDFYYPAKELKFKGWLNERIKEVNYLSKRMLKRHVQIFEIETSDKADTEKYKTKIVKIQNKINTFVERRNLLLQDIAVRSRVYLDRFCEGKSHALPEIDQKTTCLKFSIYDGNITLDINGPPSKEDILRNAEIEKQLRKNFKKHRLDLIMKGLSFSGMVLLAVSPFVGPAAPFLAIPGLVIVTCVAGYYIYVHWDEIKHFAKKIKQQVSITTHSLFHKDHNEIAHNHESGKMMLNHAFKI